MASPDARPGHPLYVGYTLALVTCAVAGLVQSGLESILGDRFPLAVFSAAIAAAAWTGGSGPGLLATLCAALAGIYFFFEPRYSFEIARPADSIALILFILTGILISLSMRRLRRQASSDRDARREAERLLQQAAHLQDLTSALSRAKTPREVTHACLVELLHAASATAGAFAVVTDDGLSYEYVDILGAATGGKRRSMQVPLTSRTLVAEAIRRHELVAVESWKDTGDTYPDCALDPMGTPSPSAAAVPIQSAHRTIAVVLMLFEKPRRLTGDERQLLLMAGSRTGQALERARLYDMTERARAEAEDFREKADVELRERQRVEEALRESEAKYRGLAARTSRLYELSAGLSEAVTVDAVARVIVRQGKVVVGSSAASVSVLTEGGADFETLYAEDYPRSVSETWKRYPADAGLMSTAAVTSRQPVLVSSFAELQKLYPQSAGLAADGGYSSGAALPLLIENSVMGVLSFHFTAPVHFDSGYAALLLSVAQHCAQALDRARLYESAQAARSAAEEANRSKDEFLSTVSHELRTPLNAMLGWASLLRNGTLDSSRTARAIEAIYNNATRQTHLIEELLDVSRIVAGRAPLDPERLDIGENIRGAVEAILPLAEGKSLHVQVQATRGVTVVADPRRLEQVFLNILSNAVKFTPAGGSISVDMQVAGGRAEVRVTDTGAGIEPAFLPHVFDRFRQADSTMARSVGGLGLGLFIARHLTEAQGGRIVAQSPGEGQGATFTVSFPIANGRPAAPAPATPARPVEPHAPITVLAGVRVLLVDDEPDAREVMVSALETAGASVRTAVSADDASGLLTREPFDVLLSDLAMPEKDGYTLLSEIRSQTGATYANIPAAAVTASAGEDERARALAAGFQAHLAKPVPPGTLAATVAALAAQRVRTATSFQAAAP